MKSICFLSGVLLLALSLGLAACGSTSTTTGSTSGGGPVTAAGSAADQPGSPPAGGSSTRRAGGSKPEDRQAGPKAEAKRSEPRFISRTHHDTGGGSEQFVTKGGDNSVQEYGSEKAGAEFAEAATAVHTYLDARAEGAWGAACKALSRQIVDGLVRQFGSTGGSKVACPELLEALSAGIPAVDRRRAAQVDIAALRSTGNGGFVLFKGAGEDLFIPMRREGGHWKVAAIAASPLS